MYFVSAGKNVVNENNVSDVSIMFASLKNKIREETGSDISKLTSKISSSTTSVQQRFDSLRGRHSHQGSTSSINSVVSAEGVREDVSINESKIEDEVKKKLTKIESGYARKLDEKETEWKEKFGKQDKHVKELEDERENVNRILFDLREQLSVAEGYKQKLMEYQEDKDQLENFQTQEIAKVKHLVLLREQELADRNVILKDCTQQMEKLRAEVARLRRQEQLLADVQDDLESLRHSSARDLAAIASELARSEEERRHLNDLVAVLRQRTQSPDDDSENQIMTERKLLEQRLEEAHLHLADIKTSWSDKIAALETQVGRLSRQAAEEGAERRRAVEEKDTLSERLKQMECELECCKLELNNKETKITRLLREIEDLTSDMRTARSESDEEITILRQKIENSKTECSDLHIKIAQLTAELECVKKEQNKLALTSETCHKDNANLHTKITKLEQELMDERKNSLDVQKQLNKEMSERNTALLRNAEISQQMEIIKQESRHKENEVLELLNKVSHLENTVSELNKLQAKPNVENDLKRHVAELEEQLAEKNKNIKSLQMRLTDMKKTLQQELRAPGQNSEKDNQENTNPVAIISPSQSTTKHLHTNSHKDEDDINFKYLKHVIIKFLTSREYEAQHLTRAVATLLKLSPDEEKLLADTLEWRMSWFGTKPTFGFGQTAKAIPPS